MYEQVFRRVLFPAYEGLWHRRRTVGYLEEYERTQWLPAGELQLLQLQKLNRLLAFCWEHVPYLRRRWSEHGLSPRPLQDPADLARYPTTTKADIVANYADSIARPWVGRTLNKRTGGSTGDPFKFEYTMESYARRNAVMWRGYGWEGLPPGRRGLYVWGRGPQSRRQAAKDALYNAFFNRTTVDAYGIRDENVDGYLARIDRERPRVLVGYVAPLLVLARGLAARGRRLEGLESVITGAEALHAPERRLMEAGFGCPVYNTYGCREFMLLAAECNQREGLHVSADHLVLETLGPDGAPVRGTPGDVAVTDLHNYGMPFVRYLGGDRATWGTRPCACGRGLPLLASVEGRILDIIVTPDGRQIPGEYFVHVMLEWPQVRRWRFVQTAPDRGEYLLVCERPLSDDERAALVRRTESGLGDALKVSLSFMDDLPPTRSDKRRLTVAYRAAS
jgi:phenylacetate-CoA ligase